MALLLGWRSGPAGAASWPAFRHDSRRSGTTGEQAYPPLSLRWRRVLGGPVVSSPAVAYGKVYVGSRSRTLQAFDAFTGQPVWSYMARGWIDSSPAVADGRVFVSSRDGTLQCLDALTGQLLWSYATGSPDLASPVVVNGEVYTATGYPNKLLLVFNETTGAVSRSAALPSYANSSPTVDPAAGLVYVGTNDGRYSAFDLSSLSLKWSSATVGGIYYSTLAEGPGYVVGLPGNDDLSARAFNPANGQTAWVSPPLASNSLFVGSPAAAGPVVVAAAGSSSHALFGLDAASGAQLWTLPIGPAPDSGFASSPAAANDVVYVGGGDGMLYAVSLATGGVLGSYSLGSPVLSSPAVANGWVYVGTMNGQLFAFQSSRVTALASPDVNLTPQVSGVVPLMGYVLAPDFSSYKVEVGSGTAPSAWSLLASSTAPANGSVLANWNTLSLMPGFYSVRLTETSQPANALVSVSTAVFAVTQSSVSAIAAAIGGTVQLGDGTELDIPAGALAADGVVTVTRMLTGYAETGFPAGARSTPVVRDVTLAGVPHPTFKLPVTLKMPYGPPDLPPGAVEKNLRIYFYDTAQAKWRIVNSSTVHADEKRVWASMDHFTTFRILEYVPQAGDLVQSVYTYPNPARGSSLTFKFLLNQDADVRIVIYDVSGEPVAELTQPGNPGGIASTLTWNMASKASGVYVYIFQATSAGGSQKVRKFLSIVH